MIRFYLVCLAVCMITTFLSAQQKAVTETGEEVVLYSNGTWVYVNKDSISLSEIPVNPQPFKKENKASFLLKSTRIDVGCWIDPKKWSFHKSETGAASEYNIENTDMGLYGLFLTESIELPVETLAKIALVNASKAAPDVRLISKEYRTVNGIRVLMMKMSGTIDDILFTYHGYYYASEKGTVQFLVYSSEENMSTHTDTVESLLNGFVVMKE